MSNLQLALKLVHILGAAVLFGTGLGIAFFMWMGNRTREPAAVAAIARIVVIADALFTASAVVVQPISGVALAWLAGYSLAEPGAFSRMREASSSISIRFSRTFRFLIPTKARIMRRLSSGEGP